MIPKIIHCCWFGGPKTALAKRCLASWRRIAPDWTIREFTLPPDLPGFVAGAIKAGKWAMVSDWARMRALYDEGGVYLDFDVELVRPLDDLLDREWCSTEYTTDGGTWLNPGGGIALEKGSAIAKAMLEAYATTPFDPERQMMPFINERLAAASELHPLALLPPEVLSPIDCAGRMHRTDATRGIHHYSMSWAPWWRRALQWVSWHGGRPVIDAMLRARKICRHKR